MNKSQFRKVVKQCGEGDLIREIRSEAQRLIDRIDECEERGEMVDEIAVVGVFLALGHRLGLMVCIYDSLMSMKPSRQPRTFKRFYKHRMGKFDSLGRAMFGETDE